MPQCRKCKASFELPEGTTKEPPFCPACTEEVRLKQQERQLEKERKEKEKKEKEQEQREKEEGRKESKEEKLGGTEAELEELKKSFGGESSAMQSCARMVKESKDVDPTVLFNALKATRVAMEAIPGAKVDQLLYVFIQAFKRGSSVVLGGSRVKSYFTGKTMHREDGDKSGLGPSDLDIGYGNLNVGQASAINQGANSMGPPPIEQFLILEGKDSNTFGKLPAPEVFFHKTGERPRDDPKWRIEPIATPSGCITFCPDGTIQENGPEVTPDRLEIPANGRKRRSLDKMD